MLKIALNQTDNFLFNVVKKVFEKAELNCKMARKKLDLKKELDYLKEEPLITFMSDSTKFEKVVKFRIKIILGIFFVAIPLIGFLGVTNFYGIHYSYAFPLTLIITLLATSRMDEIVIRYAQTRAIGF